MATWIQMHDLFFLFFYFYFPLLLLLQHGFCCCLWCQGGWFVSLWYFFLLSCCWFCCHGIAEVGFGGHIALAWSILWLRHGFWWPWLFVLLGGHGIKILFAVSLRLAMGLHHCRFWWLQHRQGWLAAASPRSILVAATPPRSMLLLQQCTANFLSLLFSNVNSPFFTMLISFFDVSMHHHSLMGLKKIINIEKWRLEIRK